MGGDGQVRPSAGLLEGIRGAVSLDEVYQEPSRLSGGTLLEKEARQVLGDIDAVGTGRELVSTLEITSCGAVVFALEGDPPTTRQHACAQAAVTRQWSCEQGSGLIEPTKRHQRLAPRDAEGRATRLTGWPAVGSLLVQRHRIFETPDLCRQLSELRQEPGLVRGLAGGSDRREGLSELGHRTAQVAS